MRGDETDPEAFEDSDRILKEDNNLKFNGVTPKVMII